MELVALSNKSGFLLGLWKYVDYTIGNKNTIIFCYTIRKEEVATICIAEYNDMYSWILSKHMETCGHKALGSNLERVW